MPLVLMQCEYFPVSSTRLPFGILYPAFTQRADLLPPQLRLPYYWRDLSFRQIRAMCRPFSKLLSQGHRSRMSARFTRMETGRLCSRRSCAGEGKSAHAQIFGSIAASPESFIFLTRMRRPFGFPGLFCEYLHLLDSSHHLPRPTKFYLFFCSYLL
jgi:hypothetical protein